MSRPRNRKAKPVLHVPGYEGSELFVRERPIHGTRQKQRHVVRCAPGTFERRYGVGEHDAIREALYQAGVKFTGIIEAAGLDGPGTVDWSRAGTTQWRDLPMTRLIALDEWKLLNDPEEGIGKLATRRLTLYCVQGMTTSQIARKFRVSPKLMAVQLNSDLATAAVHFGYAPRAGR